MLHNEAILSREQMGQSAVQLLVGLVVLTDELPKQLHYIAGQKREAPAVNITRHNHHFDH